MNNLKKSSILYQISLRSFTPEGTLKGAEKMLPHIASLGFDIVYLCPCFDSDDDTDPIYWSPNHKKSKQTLPTNPYRMRDYFKIDEEYGTDADLRDFVNTAHDLGLKVLLDLVYFHCGPKAVFIEEHPDFVLLDENGNVTCGRWNFPQINFGSAELREYLYSNMEYFIKEFGVDGYRCDVAEHIPLDFWEEGRRRVDAINPNTILIDEGDQAPYNEVAFDAYYNFKFGYNLRKTFKHQVLASDFVAAAKEMQEKMPKHSIPLLFNDNHDTVKDVIHLKRLEAIVGHDRMEASLVIIYTSEGIPFIYNGNEICDEQNHTLYANRFTAPNYRINWSNAVTPAAERRIRIMRQLADLHRNNPVIANGSTEWLTVSEPDHVVAYSRILGERKISVIVNTTDAALKFVVDTIIDKNAKILMQNGAVITSCDEHTHVSANPGGYIVVEH